MDGLGPDGRATFSVLALGTRLSNGDRTYWTLFHHGNRRITLTERRTKQLLADFMSFVRTNGKPCGECKKHFLGN
jgi:hypothetical protein